MVDENKSEEQPQVIEAEVVHTEKQLQRQDGPRVPVKVEQELDVAAVVKQVEAVKELLSKVMEIDLHYGKIPGSGAKARPTLLKPGAEMLCVLFRFSPELKITRTDLDVGHREYEVVTTLVQNTTGRVFGQGVGSCTTREKKYAWRKGALTCPDCGYSPVLKSNFKPEFYCWTNEAKGKGGCGNTWPLDDEDIVGQDVEARPNPDLADTYNTVLKMAKKRSLVDAVLTSTAASFLFTQDIEDTEKGAKGYDPAKGSGGPEGSGAPESGDPGPESENPAPAPEKAQDKPKGGSSKKAASKRADPPKPAIPRPMEPNEVKRGLLLFEPYGVGLEALESKLGKTCEKWTIAEAKKLKTVHDALQQGEAIGQHFTDEQLGIEPKTGDDGTAPEPGSNG